MALGLLASVVGCGAMPEPSADDVRAAIIAGNLGEAVELAEEALGDDPGDPELHFELARAQAMMGNRGRAIDALANAVDFGLANVDAALRDPAFAEMAAMPRFIELARLAAPAQEREFVRAQPEVPVRVIEAGSDVSISTTSSGGTVIRAGDVVLETDF